MQIQIVDRAPGAMPINGPFFMRGMKPSPVEEPPTPVVGTPITPRDGEAIAEAFRYAISLDFRRGHLRAMHRSPKAPLQIVGRPGPSMPARIRLTTAARQHEGTADPIWDRQFALKFSKAPAPDAPLVTPKGAARVIANFLDRAAELQYLTETQHLELATTRAEMRANQIPMVELDHVPHETLGSHEAAQATGDALTRVFRLPDGADGKPRYGTLQFIANMARRIEWERWRSENGPLARTVFTALPDGQLGIAALKRGAKADEVLALKRDHKARWIAAHGSLPGTEIVELAESLKGTRIKDRMGVQSLERYDRSRLFGDEDPDPGRIGYHADEDPKPFRALYPFGDCRRCDLTDQFHPRHRGCTQLGNALFAEFLERWEHRQTDVGYAGPRGQLGVDEDFVDPDGEFE